MAIRDCFYIKNLNPTQYFDLTITADTAKAYNIMWKYAVEPADGAELVWYDFFDHTGACGVRFQPNRKIYFRGTASLAKVNAAGQALYPASGFRWSGMAIDKNYGLEIGGSPQSLLWDGDGANTATRTDPDGNIYTFGHFLSGFTDFPLYLQNLILPDVKCPHYYERFFPEYAYLFNVPNTLVQAESPEAYQYYEMFYRTKITAAPKKFLKATTFGKERSYGELFWNCSRLEEIWVNFTEWPTNNGTYQWVYGVSPTGVFHCPESLPKIYDNSHIPIGWTVETFPDPRPLKQQPISATFCRTRPKGGRKV